MLSRIAIAKCVNVSGVHGVKDCFFAVENYRVQGRLYEPEFFACSERLRFGK
jgi:hypothetical protein